MAASLDLAISAIRSGRKEEGRKLLNLLIQQNPNDERAWLWMSSVVRSDDQRARCLYHVLAIDPGNQLAQRGLQLLGTAASDSRPVKINQNSLPIQYVRPALPASTSFPRPLTPPEAPPESLQPPKSKPQPPQPAPAPAPEPSPQPVPRAVERRPFLVSPEVLMKKMPFLPARVPNQVEVIQASPEILRLNVDEAAEDEAPLKEAASEKESAQPAQASGSEAANGSEPIQAVEQTPVQPDWPQPETENQRAAFSSDTPVPDVETQQSNNLVPEEVGEQQSPSEPEKSATPVEEGASDRQPGPPGQSPRNNSASFPASRYTDTQKMAEPEWVQAQQQSSAQQPAPASMNGAKNPSSPPSQQAVRSSEPVNQVNEADQAQPQQEPNSPHHQPHASPQPDPNQPPPPSSSAPSADSTPFDPNFSYFQNYPHQPNPGMTGSMPNETRPSQPVPVHDFNSGMPHNGFASGYPQMSQPPPNHSQGPMNAPPYHNQYGQPMYPSNPMLSPHHNGPMSVPMPNQSGSRPPSEPVHPIHSQNTMGMPPPQYPHSPHPMSFHSNITAMMPTMTEAEARARLNSNYAIPATDASAMALQNNAHQYNFGPQHAPDSRFEDEESDGEEINILAVIIFGTLSITALGGFGMLILLMFTAPGA